ncbi:hypothetical protein C7256_04050 [Enterocloster lavalensis]|nr:hypothetical protein C7256_04050 [Enterocloster lavalensis]
MHRDVNIHYSIANRVETRAKTGGKGLACGFFLGNFMRIDMDCGSLSAARLKEHFGLPDYTPLERDDGRNNF